MGCISSQRYVAGIHSKLHDTDKLLQRYISPLIAPPTPPQLEKDKENIDEQFSRAFTLIEQLSVDTAALKTAEEARTERLDGALKDVESLVADLKNSSRRRDDETRRINDEVKSLKDAIPKALEGAREGNENRLKELGTELKSLKTLLGNRLGGNGASPAGRSASSASFSSGLPTRPAPEETSAGPPPAVAATNGLASTASPAEQGPTQAAAPVKPASNNPLSQLGRSAAIPAWQMAAADRSKSKPNSQSTTPAASTAGADTSSSQEQTAPSS